MTADTMAFCRMEKSSQDEAASSLAVLPSSTAGLHLISSQSTAHPTCIWHLEYAPPVYAGAIYTKSSMRSKITGSIELNVDDVMITFCYIMLPD